MRCIFFLCSLGIGLLLGAPQPNCAAAQTAAPEPKTSMGWFERASNQMNLRMPGCEPFRMKVTFHALSGLEFLPKGKSLILTGDGVYEETWLSPHEWRREVTLGSYHGVEAQVAGARKMGSSSDYEPSRVLMLLEALLNPISRYVLSPELHAGRVRWKTEQLTVGGQAFVRISTSASVSTRLTLGTAYIFLADGSLVQSNEDDVITNWQDDFLVHGKTRSKAPGSHCWRDQRFAHCRCRDQSDQWRRCGIA